MKIIITDKDTGRVFWTETLETKEEALKIMKQLKENHFNPEYFSYKIVKA